MCHFLFFLNVNHKSTKGAKTKSRIIRHPPPSLRNFLFYCPKAITEKLQSVEESYHYDLPF